MPKHPTRPASPAAASDGPPPLATAEERRLYWSLRNRKRRTRTIPVSDTIRNWIETGVVRRFDVNVRISELLHAWMPAALLEQLAIESLRDGRLRLLALQSAPAFLFQRDWRERLLRRFRDEAPALGLRSISVSIGSISVDDLTA